MKEFRIDRNDADQRLDRYLAKLLPGAGKGLLQKSLRKKNITVNGKKASPQDMVQEGDLVKVFFSDETLDKFMKDRKKFVGQGVKVLYEDDNLILLDKPLGRLTHSSKDCREGNMVDDLVAYLIQKGDYNPRLERTFTPAFCNRLDRNTSGILIGAKNAQALRLLNQAMQDREIEKHYYALVRGTFKDQTRVTKSGRKIQEKNKMVTGDDLDMETIFRPVISGDYSLVDANLLTGKTHQIRYHLQSLGFPILGDKKYGDGGQGQWLHNYQVIFHTQGDLAYLKDRVFTSPIPEKLDRIARDYLGQDYKKKL